MLRFIMPNWKTGGRCNTMGKQTSTMCGWPHAACTERNRRTKDLPTNPPPTQKRHHKKAPTPTSPKLRRGGREAKTHRPERTLKQPAGRACHASKTTEANTTESDGLNLLPRLGQPGGPGHETKHHTTNPLLKQSLPDITT